MKMIIDISEDAYKAICNGCMLPPDVENTVNAIKNGTPIPEPYGRIVDEGKIHTVYTHTEESINYNGVKFTNTSITHTDAPTIIEGQYGIASEPFINKPCISEGVCHEDKMQTLDKLRAEIEQTADEEQKRDKLWATGLRYAVKIIDKYRTKESEE